MALSAFDLYSIGIGPSSSHTVGPMRAARMFADELRTEQLLAQVTRVKSELFGSLGATGRGHSSDRAVVLGLEGADPATVDPATVGSRFDEVARVGTIRINGTREIAFDLQTDVVLH